MNKERRVGRRSVVQNLVKLTPEFDNEEKVSIGPKKALFDDDTFVMKRTLKPLHEINNFQFSSSKSKSHDKLYTENTFDIPKSTYMDMFNNHNKIPLSPPSRIKLLESSMGKSRQKPCEPVLQSKELFNTLIDSPCTKYEKVQFNNALSSASKYLLNRHLESVQQNADIFNVSTPDVNLCPVSENHFNKFTTPSLIDLSITPKPDICQTHSQSQTSNLPLLVEVTKNNDDIYQNQTSNMPLLVEEIEGFKNKDIDDIRQTQISNLSLLVEDIEELKKKEIDDIRQTKSQCCDLMKTRFKEIELEIEKHFGIMENKVNENYDKLIKKFQDGNNDSVESQTSIVTTETVKEKNYTRMTGAFGIFNNLNKDCSFLKTPKTKGKTREEMLNKGVLTPCTMSFVLQEQLMHLNSSS
ncbi:uncharacterized protein LOC100165170 [Acyrthosiphon pisum]|uniref:Uncharacterized protein n=1 Tax=Acyrthosiphon pisum TaxID=7029 RepID=A0A8R2A6Q6_ACYPI|nr:uncharacterized protein LOC100165170 [Acyrthosiphon pisum]|eukprot:XP_001952616.2 PREDICTED: uncharacterized protein LOC100165170 [Acyrthosiphon pisum]